MPLRVAVAPFLAPLFPRPLNRQHLRRVLKKSLNILLLPFLLGSRQPSLRFMFMQQASKMCFHFPIRYFLVGLVGILLLTGQPVWAQDGGNVPTVKARRSKKKVKKVNPNRLARPVKDKYRPPLSQPNSSSHKDQYSPPPSLRKSGKVKDTYLLPRSITSLGKVKDNYTPPPSKSRSEKVRASDADPMSAPDAEEGNEKAHLPLLDRIFNRYNRYHRQKERYLQNLSIQLSGYQGDMRVRKDRGTPDKSVGSFKGPVTIPSRTSQRKAYEKVSADHDAFAGHQKQLRPFLLQKIEKNKAYYMAKYQGQSRVLTPKGQTRYHKKLAAQVHQHEGGIRVKKRFFGDDKHPSVHHLAQKSKASYQQKERHRKRRVWITHIFKSKEQPQHLKEKVRKPRYDSKESEIWYY